VKKLFLLITILLCLDSFGQNSKDAKVREYSKEYPDWVVLKNNIDTVTCKVYWHNDTTHNL